MARSLSGSRDDAPTTRRRSSAPVDVEDEQGDGYPDGDDTRDEDLAPEEPRTSRRRSSREDSDDTPRRPAVQRRTMRDAKPSGKASGGNRAAVGKGFAAYKKVTRERSQDFNRLEVDDTPQLIKFAEPEPFAFFYRHWVQTDAGKRPYVCLGDECPLCDVGDEAKPVMMFNVITVADASLRVWEASKDPARQIQKRYDDAASSPLDREDLYFAVSKEKKKNNFFEFTVEKVKARDLEEDYDTEPLTAEEIDEATKKLFDDTVVRVPTKADLREVVKSLED